MAEKNLEQFAVMIRYAADTRKYVRIKEWLNNYFESSSIWNNPNSDTAVQEFKTQMFEELDNLCNNAGDKSKAVKVFSRASHYEIAASTGDFKTNTEIANFIVVLEWTLANTWVISKIDPNLQLSIPEIPRWCVEHRQEIANHMSSK